MGKLLSVSSGSPNNLSFGFPSLSYSNNSDRSIDDSRKMSQNQFNKYMREREAAHSPSDFGNHAKGPIVRGNRRADAYSRRLSKLLGETFTPSPYSLQRKNKKKTLHLARVAEKRKGYEKISARRAAATRSVRSGGRIFKFKKRKQQTKKQKKTKKTKKTKKKKTKIKIKN